MATTQVKTNSETPIWVLCCSEYESCEIESINESIAFIESANIPTDLNDLDTMTLIKNVPRLFKSDGTYKMWIRINSKNLVTKRPYTASGEFVFT